MFIERLWKIWILPWSCTARCFLKSASTAFAVWRVISAAAADAFHRGFQAHIRAQNRFGNNGKKVLPDPPSTHIAFAKIAAVWLGAVPAQGFLKGEVVVVGENILAVFRQGGGQFQRSG